MNLLSIVIPTFNRPDKLRNLLLNIVDVVDSVDELKIIVVDDGSFDFNRKKINDLEREFKSVDFLYLDKNKGACCARNTGANYLKSTWYWFFDDDDYVDSLTINLVIENLLKQNITNKLIFLSSKIIKNGSYIKEIIPVGNNLKRRFYTIGHEVNTSCVLFNYEIFNELNGWDESLVAGQDTDIFLRASKTSDALVLPDCFVIFNNHDGIRITSSPKKQMLAKIQFIRKHHKNISYLRLFKYIFTFVFCIPYLRFFLQKIRY